MGTHRQSAVAAQSKIRSAVIEALESRRMLSIAFIAGLVRVHGTAGDDVMSAEFNADGTTLTVRHNTMVRHYKTSTVNLILFAGREGNDLMTLASNVYIPAQIYGEG